MPSVVAVVGYSNSGKTRVATHLVSALASQGYRIAAIKHCHDGHDADRSGSDTAKLREAGAVTTIASSPGLLTTVQQVNGDSRLETLARAVGEEIDIVIAEGFKASSVPKVLVVGDDGRYPEVENVIAVVSDKPGKWELMPCNFGELDALANRLRRELLE